MKSKSYEVNLLNGKKLDIDVEGKRESKANLIAFAKQIHKCTVNQNEQ